MLQRAFTNVCCILIRYLRFISTKNSIKMFQFRTPLSFMWQGHSKTFLITFYITVCQLIFWISLVLLYHQLRARSALSIFKDVPLRARRMLSLYNVYGNSTFLLNIPEHFFKVRAPFWFSTDDMLILINICLVTGWLLWCGGCCSGSQLCYLL